MIGGSMMGLFTAGKTNIDNRLYRLENFNEISSAAECCAVIKHAIDHVRSDSYFEAILGVVQRLLSEKSEAAVELGDQGLCDQLDNILGQKIASQSICGLCLLIILALLKNNSTLSRSLPRSALLTAVVGLVTNVDEYGNKKRLTSSSTIFRIVKACHTHNTDPSVLQTGLEIISMMLTESDDTPSKLVSCGVCELLGLSIRQHSSSEPLVVLLCACINKLVMFDIDQSGGSLGSQDKLAENFVCEMLIGKVLPLKLNPSIQSASAAVRAVGSLARRHSNNSDRLGACNACEAVMELCINPYLEDAQFAASICWCFANLSFPNEENQDKLGNSGACEVVLNILNQYGENTEIVQEGCRAMHQLAEFHDENLARFYEGNGFSVCNELIYKFNTRDDVLQWIMYALSTLVEHLEDLKKIHEVGLIDKIVELLSRFVANEDLVQWSATTIANLCQDHDSAVQFHSVHCCQMLLQALGRHLVSEDVCEEVLHAIGALAEALPESRQTFSENSVADFVVKTFEQHPSSEAVFEQGLYALSSMLHLSRDQFNAANGLLLSLAILPIEDRAQQRLHMSIAYAMLTNGGLGIVSRLLIKFCSQNSMIALCGAKLLGCLCLGGVLLDRRAETAVGVANQVGDGHLSRLGSAGVGSPVYSLISSHLSNSSIIFWAVFTAVHLTSCSTNLGPDICSVLLKILETHMASADVAALSMELVYYLCMDSNYRLLLGSGLESEGRHLILSTMKQHHMDSRVVAAGCRAISALCVSPNQDAMASVFAQDTGRITRVTDVPDEEGCPRKSSSAGATEWSTYSESVDHLNTIIPVEEPQQEESAPAVSSTEAPSVASSILRRLSLSWPAKRSEDVPSPSAATIHRPSVAPISAMYDQTHSGLAPPTPSSGQQFILDAANSIISTGLSDQEERIIIANRQRHLQRKTNSELLVDGGALQTLRAILSRKDVEPVVYRPVLACALNALNSLLLHLPNRMRAHELGLLETIAEVYASAVRDPARKAVRELKGLNLNNLQEEDWIRVMVIVASIVLGTSCLSEAVDADIAKGAEQMAAIHLNQDVLGNLGVIDDIALALSNAAMDVGLTEVSLRALHLITMNNENNQHQAAIPATNSTRTAVAEVVKAARELIASPRVSYYACLAVAALASNSEENCRLLSECGICKVVLRILSKYIDHEEVVEAACQAIQGLKALNEELGHEGVSEYIVQALNLHDSSASVSEWVCRAIGSLAESKFNKIELEKHNITKIVTAILQRHVAVEGFLASAFSRDRSSAGVAQWGCTAIYYLAKGYDAEGFQKRLVAAGACDAVARALMKYAEVEAVAYSCCRALVVLVDRNEALRSKPVLSSVCQYIVESLHLFPSSVLVAKWGCRAAAVLAESHDVNIAKLGAAGACESIPLIIQSHPASEEVAVAGCKVIAFMSENPTNGFAARFGHAGACEAVVGAIRKHIASPVAVARASIAINTLAIVPGNARWFGPAGACDALLAALQLHKNNAGVTKFIVAAIGQLCIIDHNKERLGVLGACEAVVRVGEIHVQDLDTAQSCADTVGKLCETVSKSAHNSGSAPPKSIATDGNIPEAVMRDPHYLAGRRNRAILLHCGAPGFLAKALDNHLADAGAAQCICKAISLLAQAGDACVRERTEFGQLGACQAVTKALLFHEGIQEVAVFACFAVQSLAHENDENQMAFNVAGACPLVVQVLRAYRHSPSIIPTEAAARSICSLSAGSMVNKATLGSCGVCEGLLESLELHSRHLDLTFLLLKALFHICDGAAANRTRISFSGAPDILYNILARFVEEEKVVDFALSILIGLSLDKVGQSKLGSVGVPKVVVALLARYEKSDHITALAIALIGSLCRNSKANQDKFAQLSAAKALASVLTKHSTSNLRSNGKSASKAPSDLLSAEPSKADECFLEVDQGMSLVNYIGEVNVLKEACRTVYYFCLDHEANRQRLRVLGVMDLLTALVSASMLADGDKIEVPDQTKWWARNAMEVLMTAR